MPSTAGPPPAEVDFLVVGSGVAGLTYGLRTAPHGSTLIVTKKSRAESNSNYAQGGIAGVMSDDDDVRLHLQDTLVAGAGICHEDAVHVLVTEGPERIRDLIRLGAQFSMESDESGAHSLALGREGGHSRNRIVHAVDRTGWECERTLLAAAKDAPDLTILEHLFAADLAVSGTGTGRRCVGAYVLDTASGETYLVRAPLVLLATGGCGCIYKHTTNPAIATGDGVAMAWRAGATVANMEFIQFHPTSLYHPEGQSFLISEAVRGEGGILRNEDGSTFMHRYHPLAELAPRDIVARAIHAERLKHGKPCVFLDITHLDADYIRRRFPTIHGRCLELGLDITSHPIPVVPAAHYQCGGILTDLMARTSLPGLLAAGEVACTGVHGANRLASNSLLEAMVFGYRAATEALARHATGDRTDASADAGMPDRAHTVSDPHSPTSRAVADETARLRSEMNDHVGIVRNDRALAEADDEIGRIQARVDAWTVSASPDPDLCELRNMALVAGLIVRSAIERKESRGLQYTTDHPELDDLAWKRDTVLHPA